MTETTTLHAAMILAAAIPSLLALALLAAWVVRRIEFSEERYVICGYEIDHQERVVFAGRALAMDPTTAEIITSAATPGALRAEMRERHMGRPYEIVQVPPIDDGVL